MPEITTTDGTRLHIEDSGGSGSPVVLIHGWPLSGESWELQVPALTEAGHRVITYDRRGFGRSDKPDAGYDYDTLAADLAALLEGLDLRGATLVGFSMGGGEVVRYLSAHGSDRVDRAMLISAVPPFLMQGEDNPEGPLPPAMFTEMRDSLEQDREAFFPGFIEGFFSAGDTVKVGQDDLDEALRLALQSRPEAALATMDAWATTDFRPDLAAIDVPLLIVHGDSDATVPVEGSGARVHDALPESRLEIIADGPHGIPVSHSDQVSRALLDFLGD